MRAKKYHALFFLKHQQHSVRHPETADDVDIRQDDCDQTKECTEATVLISGSDQGSDNRNSTDRIRTGHQWRVQGRWDFRDDLKSNNHR